jgi:lipopolysaccharide biosynthesis regulator YciM
MDFSWWLVPLAGLAGWCIGHDKIRHAVTGKRSSRDSTDLAALLPGHDDRVERDSELDSLLHQYPVDDTSFDIYRTLGDAFRRRGEYSRAIGVHEHLLATGKLGSQQRRKAILELSRDYAGAGLLDRVEALLVPLVQEDPNEQEASTQLLRLYEKQQDWQSAIDLASSTQSIPDAQRNELVAQYCCEIAALRELEDDLEASEMWLKRALKSEPQCSRALLMLGRRAIELKEFEAALNYFHQVELHHPELSPEIAESVFYALQESGDSKAFQQHIDYIRERHNSYSVIKLARDAISRLEGDKIASEFFIEQVARRPSLKGLRDWAERELEITKPRDKEKVAAMVEMLRHVVEEKPVYRCDRCGYRCKQIQWRCPGCENWNSVKVIIGAEGE